MSGMPAQQRHVHVAVVGATGQVGAVLRRLWLGDAQLRNRLMDMPIYGRGQPVGAVIPVDI